MSACFIKNRDQIGTPMIPTAWGPFDPASIETIVQGWIHEGTFEVYTGGEITSTFSVEIRKPLITHHQV